LTNTLELSEFWLDPSGDVLIWEFAGADNNERAVRLLQLIFQIQRQGLVLGEVFLSAIELEMEPGKFPDALCCYFADPTWSFSKRFCCAPACRNSSDHSLTIGHLTFEGGRAPDTAPRY
jgi:hypothetical protein